MKKLIALTMTLIFVLMLFLPSAFAYTGGLLNGLSMRNYDNVPTDKLTDNNESTGYLVGTTPNYHYLYALISGQDQWTVSSYRLKADGTASTWRMDLCTTQTSCTQVDLINDGAVHTITTYSGLMKVLVVNKDSTARMAYEFDVFGSYKKLTPPPVPGGLSGTTGLNSTDLTWSPVVDQRNELKGYNIYRNSVKVNTTPISGTTYKDTGLASNTSYTYQVTSIDNFNNESVKSTGVGVKTKAIPTTPTGLNVTNGNKEVTLSWNPVSGATGYNIYQDSVKVNNDPLNVTTYKITGLTNGTDYSYQVSAVNDYGESAKSGVIIATPYLPAPPATPTGIQAAPGNTAAEITWESVAGATGYNVYQNGVLLTTTPITETIYVATGLTNETTYDFQVTALGEGGESVKSSVVHVKPSAMTAPMAPTGLKVSVGEQKVTLEWNPVAPPVTKYFIYRDGVLIKELTDTTTYVDSGLTDGTKYRYEVSAVNDYGESTKREIFAIPAKVTDFSTLELPFTVAGMIQTALNFLGLFPTWILLVLGVLFSSALIYIVMLLIDRVRKKETEKENYKTEREKRQRKRYAGMTKEEWDKFSKEEIKRTDDYFKRTGRVYEKRSASPKVVDELRQRERRKDGSLNSRERKRIEERTQRHILKMRKAGI